MNALLERLLGRLPIGWLQLSHNKGRFAAAIAGVAFATLLVLMQLGIQGAMKIGSLMPYSLLNADIIISANDGSTLTDRSNVARARMFQALGVAGVAAGAPAYIGMLEFRQPNGVPTTLQTFGFSVADKAFTTPGVAAKFDQLALENTSLIDTKTRGVDATIFADLEAGTPYPFEVNGQTLTAVDTIKVGGTFAADGTMFISDQTFLRFFGNRTSNAPNHILLKVDEGISPAVVLERLREKFKGQALTIETLDAFAAADLAFQTTERPTGIVFGFGVIMGTIVGIVIVYQVLSTDVANHLREYATFKAMGYDQRFFLGIVTEEAIILAILGYIPGLVASFGLYKVMTMLTSLPVQMDGARIVYVFLGTVIACALSGAIATRRLAAADPADLF